MLTTNNAKKFQFFLPCFLKNPQTSNYNTNHFLNESEVITGKYHTEALIY